MKKFYIIHIPKTAGSSITYTLIAGNIIENTEFVHMTFHELVAMDKIPNINNTISVVRNPFERMESIWRWSLFQKTLKIGTSFTDFIMIHHDKKYTNLYTNGYWFKPQLDWLTSNNGMVNNILRFETLEDDWNTFSKKHDISVPLLHENKNTFKEKIDYHDIYTDETKAIITRIYKKDLDYFGYKY